MDTRGLVHFEFGTLWYWDPRGLIHYRFGTQWDWYAMGLGHSGTESETGRDGPIDFDSG